ncbi:MAG: hypothetical protein M1840_001715 [Geoglossum simile]|nr:MAG: hypothetical protein M1840_001715 [Geoglossum simile]
MPARVVEACMSGSELLIKGLYVTAITNVFGIIHNNPNVPQDPASDDPAYYGCEEDSSDFYRPRETIFQAFNHTLVADVNRSVRSTARRSYSVDWDLYGRADSDLSTDEVRARAETVHSMSSIDIVGNTGDRCRDGAQLQLGAKRR